MQKKYSFLMLVFVLSMLWLPMRLMAQVEGNTVKQLQFGKQVVTVATDQELTFYDPKGGQGITANSSNNAQSLTVFKPAEAGMSIQITFDSFDVRNDGDQWFGQAKIYDGEVDDTGFTWPTTTGGVNSSSKLPDGKVLETLDGTYTNKVYYSSTSDGALSVGYLYRYAKTCKGWVAKVKCVKLESMTVTGAGSQYANVVALPKSKANVNLAGVFVTTEGVMNADHLKTISFKLTKNESNSVDPLSLKLFSGSEDSFKGATPLETTISENGGIYTFTLDQVLESGNNQFTIVGDITGSEVGSKVQLDVTGVTTDAHADGVTPFTAGESVAVENPAVVAISSTPQTVTVGDTPLNFFDDGGIDGQISKDLKSATITFKPATEGKKIMVDFTKMSLATGSIYSQKVHVYNGSEANADNLLKTLEGTEVAKIRSTSADGALTVVFESNAYNTADGWEATVSQFTPQPMTVKDIKLAQYTEGTVCAGDADQQILQVCITTENTEPVLTPKKFSFTTNNTNAVISKATLYYSKTADFSTTTKVGEAAVTADAFEITAANEVAFVEGDNYFWLAYDISETAKNGQKVDAAVTSITLSDGVHNVEAGNPEGDREVLNVVLSHLDQGTVTKKVNESVVFKTKNKNDYSSDYESGNDDRINIFEPMHEGMICQIAFTKFDLYYASYGSDHATMKIYSGKGTTGDLLWESTKETKTTGPEGVLRSTSADGALTVVFNSGVSQSWNTSAGFEATVSEYLSQPMAVESVTAAQASTQILKAGAKNQDILNVNILTKGDSHQKNLNSVELNLKGSQANVTAAKLYSVKNADDGIAADAGPLATAEVTAQDETVQLTLAEPLQLKEGDNNFRVQFDISADAKAESVIDASLVAAVVDGATIAAANGDPEGERVVKNIYNMVAGDNGEVLVAEGEPLMFYDDGGIDGDYSNNFEGTVTFAPKTPGQSVKLTFKEFSLTYQDHFYIYDGGEVKETADASYSKYDSPTYFLSNTADGKVTVKFTSQYSDAGFAIEVTAYEKQPLHVASVTAASVAPESTLRGAETQMQKIAVSVEGDLNELDIQKFNFAGVDIADNAVSTMNVYATGTSDTYSAVNLFGTAAAGQLTAEGSYKITLPGTYYFWTTANISADAAVGATAASGLESITANGETSAVADAQTAQTTVRQGVSGVITVGAGADYGTIQGAIDALKGGIDGPVAINIKRGIYNENVSVPEITGASEANTVTLQSESGDWHDVKIYFDQYNEPGYSDDKMSAEFGVFTVNGADWFTLRGVEVTTTDLSFPGVIHIKNQSRHVTVDGCYIHADMTTDYQQDINLIYTYSKSEANCNNDYLTVKNCLLEGGYIGVRMGGTSTVALPKEVGGVIENNVLRNQGTKAIYCMDELGAKIRGNRIENTQTTKEFYGFDGQLRDTYADNLVIEGNTFNLSIEKAAYGISLRTFKASADAPTLIANNEVIINSDNASSFGIKLGSPTANMNVAYNTVNMTGTANSAAFYINDTSIENVSVANNIFQNLAGGYAYRYYKSECVALPVYSNNVAFTTGDVFAYDKTDIADYAAWQAVSQETGGYAEKTDFIDDAILEPLTAGNLLNAKPLAEVTADITGTPRSAEHPTIGAYEYDATDEAPVMAEGYPTVSNITDTSADITVRFDQSGIVQLLAKESTEAAPALEDVTLSEKTLTLRKNADAAMTIDGLEKDKEYIVYAVMTSLRGNSSAVYPTSKFVAGGEVIKEIPNVKIAASATESVAEGEEAELTVNVTEGTAPFSIKWQNGNLANIVLAELADFGESTVKYTPDQCDQYYVTVTDANGKSATDTCRVAVTGQAITATFDNLYLEEESFWTGPDTKGNIVTGTWGDSQYAGSFLNGSYQFSNNYSIDWASWSGVAYSNRTSTTFSTITPDQYNSAVGSGYAGTANYAVCYDNGVVTVLNNPVEGDEIDGLYITNSAWAAECIKNGNGTARKFVKDDWFKVTFTGTHADGTTSSVDYYLADYRSDKEADWYCLDTWQWVDLRPLGTVKSISFSLDGSDKGSFGLNTSAYFCLDNFNGERIVNEAPLQTSGDEIDLSQLFTFDDAAATVKYAFADELSDELKDKVTLSADGKLSVKKGYYSKFDVVVSATQKGKIQFLSIPFDIVSGINAIDADDANVKARYNMAGQKLNRRQQGVNILRTADGKTVKVAVK